MKKGILALALGVLLSVGTAVVMPQTAHAISTVENVYNETLHPEVIYTAYLGMPKSNLLANFAGAKGWTMSERQFTPEHSAVVYSRSFKNQDQGPDKGKKITEELVVRFGADDRATGIVWHIKGAGVGLGAVMSAKLEKYYGEPTWGNGNIKFTANHKPYIHVGWRIDGHAVLENYSETSKGVSTLSYTLTGPHDGPGQD